MSKIQSVNVCCQRANLKQKQGNSTQSPSFCAELSDLPKGAQNFIKDGVRAKMDKNVGPIRKLYKYLADTKGEMQTQVVNAIFTSTLAPAFIAFNPFSRADKKTKEYTAWRQPISAIIALSGVLPATLAVNAYLDKLYNEGYNKSVDLRSNPNGSYLIGQFKAEYKKAEKENRLKEFLAQYEPKNISEKLGSTERFSGNAPTKPYIKACKEGYVKAIQDERMKLFTSLITEDPKSITIDETTKAISVSVKDPKTGKVSVREIGRNIPNLTTKLELTEYLQINNLHNRKVSEFLHKEFGFEFYEDGKFKPYTINAKLKGVKARDVLEALGLIEQGKITEPELKEALLRIRQERHAPALAKKLKTTVKRAQEIFEEFGKDASSNVEFALGEEGVQVKTISLGHLLHPLDYNIEHGRLQEFMDMKMADAVIYLKDSLKGNLKNLDGEADLRTIAGNMLKVNAKKMGSHFDNSKFFAAIFFNLFMTAITCTVLNWVYPRIMDKYFPHLSDKNIKTETKEGRAK